MRLSSNTSVTHLEGTGASNIVAINRGFPLLFTLIAVFLAAVTLGGFKTGRDALWNIAYFLDGLLGGSSHTVTLPGPCGLPLVGSLIEVSCPESGLWLYLTVASSCKAVTSKCSRNGPRSMVT